MQEQDESLILHLEALRTMLIKCFVALGVGLLPMFLAAPYGMNGLIKSLSATITFRSTTFRRWKFLSSRLKLPSSWIY